MLRGKVVEQPPPLAQQHRHDVQLELVELAGSEQRLGRPGAVHHHVTVPCGRPRPGRTVVDVGGELDAARR